MHKAKLIVFSTCITVVKRGPPSTQIGPTFGAVSDSEDGPNWLDMKIHLISTSVDEAQFPRIISIQITRTNSNQFGFNQNLANLLAKFSCSVHDYKQSMTEYQNDAMFACGAGERCVRACINRLREQVPRFMVCLEVPIPQLPLMT